MTTEMPEKWTSEHYMRVNTKSATGLVLVAQTDADAKEFTKRANDAMDQAYRAGLEAGRAAGYAEGLAAAKQQALGSSQPGVRDMTDAEAAVWGQVYAAVVAARQAYFLATGNPSIGCQEQEADAAVLAMRERCGKAEPVDASNLPKFPFKFAEPSSSGAGTSSASTGVKLQNYFAMPILEDERGILECKVGGWRYIRADEHVRLIEAARAEGVEQERRRCAAIAIRMSTKAETTAKELKSGADDFESGAVAAAKTIHRHILT